MDKRDKSDFQESAPQQSCGQEKMQAKTFTSNMRFVVTTNSRNAWLDDFYDDAPDTSKQPTFH